MTLGIIIWFLRGLTKKETFRLEHQWCRLFGIGRGAIGNDLIELEKAGLVSVVRGRGRSPVVTIITGEGER